MSRSDVYGYDLGRSPDPHAAPEGKFYLAGPMSNLPQFNFPAFDYAAKWLRGNGWNIISPAELDAEETRAMAMASENGLANQAKRKWGWYLGRDVEIVADQASGIVFLNDWARSRGARLEAYTALTAGKTKFYRFYDGIGKDGQHYAPSVHAITDYDVACVLIENLEGM